MVAESSMKSARLDELGVGLGQARPVLLAAACRCAAGARRRARRRTAGAARAAPSTSRARRARPSRPTRSAACCAMFRQNEVLPIAGRAATMTRSPFCSPLVISSRSTKPVASPVTTSFDCESWSMVRKLSLTISRIDGSPARMRCSAMSKIDFSARSRSVAGLVLALEARLHDAVAGVDQVPEDRLLLDDPAPVLDVRDARDAVHERRQVRGAAHRLERRLAHAARP